MGRFIIKTKNQLAKTLYRITSFVLSNQRTLTLGLVVAIMLLIPGSASANVNFGCVSEALNPFSIAPCLFGQMVLYLASIFAFLTGNLLDLVVNLFVFNMSTTLETGNLFKIADGGIPVYREVWFIVRDLANLGFIFILIYAALGTIFKLSNVNAMKVVPQLLLVAILMNFSLFFVQVATDFSNYIAYQFFTNVSIVIDDDNDLTNNQNLVAENIGQSDQQGLSSVIMSVTKVTALVASPTQLNGNDGGGTLNGQPGFAFGVFGAIFVFIAGLVMLAGAALLFIRFFMILIYMVSSPIAFAATIVGGSKSKFFQKWSKGLASQLTFAPAYFGLLYLALKFLQAISGDNALGGSASDSSFAFWVRQAFIFGVSSAFLIYALIAAKSLGATGAGLVNRLTKQFGGLVLGGGSAALLRNTVGRGANALSSGTREARLQNLSAKGGARGAMARLQLKSLKGVAGAGYDLRSTAKYIPGITTEDLKFVGEGELGRGYDKRREEGAKKRTEEADETRKFLDDDAKAYFNARLDTKKDGLMGVLQGVAYKRDRDGTAIPRVVTDQFIGAFDQFKMFHADHIEMFTKVKSRLLPADGPIYYPGYSKKSEEQIKQKRDEDYSELAKARYDLAGVNNEKQKFENDLANNGITLGTAQQIHKNLSEKARVGTLGPAEDKKLKQVQAIITKDSKFKQETKEKLNRIEKLEEAVLKSDRAAEEASRKIFYQEKSSKLSETEKHVLEKAMALNGALGVQQQIKLLNPTIEGQDKLNKEWKQYRIDQGGKEFVEAYDEERETVRKQMTASSKALSDAERGLNQTSKELRRISSDLNELSRMEAEPPPQNTKAYQRMLKLQEQQVDMQDERGRLESLKAKQDEIVARQQVATSKSIKESMERLGRLDKLEVKLMQKNINVVGGYANKKAALAGIKELSRAQNKKDKGLDVDALARAVEQGVDDSNLGGDRNRNEGDRSSS